MYDLWYYIAQVFLSCKYLIAHIGITQLDAASGFSVRIGTFSMKNYMKTIKLILEVYLLYVSLVVTSRTSTANTLQQR